MGVMNIVAQGFVACCKRQSGCVCFFENTKIIKKLELLLLSRNRFSLRSPLLPAPATSSISTSPSLPPPAPLPSIIRLRTLSLLAQLREASTDANKNVEKTLFHKVLRQDLLGDDVLGRMATFELFKTMGPESAPLARAHVLFSSSSPAVLRVCSLPAACSLIINCLLQLHRPLTFQCCLRLHDGRPHLVPPGPCMLHLFSWWLSARRFHHFSPPCSVWRSPEIFSRPSAQRPALPPLSWGSAGWVK